MKVTCKGHYDDVAECRGLVRATITGTRKGTIKGLLQGFRV